MTRLTSLPAITALARAGAIDRAWALFEAGGHAGRTQDPAALAVMGRLLKSRARLAPSAERAGGFAAAAAAYAAADGLGPAPYLAINAATARLLAGDPKGAADGARDVLARLAAPEPLADTPYYLAATRAEALLLLGDDAGAAAAMADAAQADPDGWADRAVTLAQLEEIARAQGRGADWLEPYRPPASLHFAGHMGLAAGGAGEASLARSAAALISQERIGFGYGALAAGSDIVIAEELLKTGAELHVVLPCAAARFAAQSVAPAGAEWLGRYEALMAAAASVRIADAGNPRVHDPLATRLAGELAIGAALLGAAALDARAVQLIVLDPAGGGPNTAAQAALWPTAPTRPAHLITLPREVAVEALFPPEEDDPARELVTLVALGFPPEAIPPRASSAQLAALYAPVWEALAVLPADCVSAGAGHWDLRLPSPGLAAQTMLAVLDAAHAAGGPLPTLGAHHAIVTSPADRISGARIPHGDPPRIARRLQAMCAPGMALVSEPVAIALAAAGASAFARTERFHDGDDDGGADGAATGAIFTLLPVRGG